MESERNLPTDKNNSIDEWFYSTFNKFKELMDLERNLPPKFNTPEEAINFLKYDIRFTLLIIYSYIVGISCAHYFYLPLWNLLYYLQNKFDYWNDFLDYSPFVRSFRWMRVGGDYMYDGVWSVAHIYHRSHWWIDPNNGIRWIRQLTFNCPDYLNADLVEYLPEDRKNRNALHIFFEEGFFDLVHWGDFIREWTISFLF